MPDSGSKDRERSVSKGLETKARDCRERSVERAKCPRCVVWMKKVRTVSGMVL